MKNIVYTLMAALMLLVSACGESGPKTIKVKTAREFIEALGSNRTIIIEDDLNDLTSALQSLVDAGKIEQVGVVTDAVAAAGKPTITATDAYDGPSLNVISVENLTIEGGDVDGLMSFIVSPSYANCIGFYHCKNITIKRMYMGHAVQDGCSGDVLHFENCSNINLERAHLFGCGVIGIYTDNCADINVLHSAIFDCSDRAVEMHNTSNVTFNNTSFTDIHNDSPCYFDASNKNIKFIGCEFDQPDNWYEGNIKTSDITMTDCTLFQADGDGVGDEYNEDEQFEDDEEGIGELQGLYFEPINGSASDLSISIRTGKELLQNLGNNRTLVIENDILDLTEAIKELYEKGEIAIAPGYGDEHDLPEGISFTDEYDGPSLWLSHIQNLKIEGKKKDTHIQAAPSYANVFGLEGCKNITFENLKLGHKEQGHCIGDVLHLEGCQDIVANNCKLYGCGVIGLSANYCLGVKVRDSEIYECSQSGVDLTDVRDCNFSKCKFYQLPYLGSFIRCIASFDNCDITVEVWDDYFDGRYVINNGCKIQYDRESEY